MYATHMRSEGDAIMAALDETFRIGREAGVPVEIWHLKVAGRGNLGPHAGQVVAKIEAARAAGIDVSADTYAYTAWFNEFVRLHTALGARRRRRAASSSGCKRS